MRSIKQHTYILFLAALVACEGSSSDLSTTGQGGSMTRFAIHDGYMYVVDHSQLNVFDIRGKSFEEVGVLPVTIGLETIFASNDFLYMGASDAMYIYNVSKPSEPTFVFRYSHIVSCDPVVVRGNRAYVTLRSGSLCNRGANALEILDISDPYSPVLLANVPVTSPYGLAVDNNLLFLCEGEYGIKVLDISNESSVKLLAQVDDIFSYDAIAKDGVLIITGEDGVFQFSYDSSDGTLNQLSKVSVTRTDV